MTVNQILVLMKTVRERVNGLKTLRTQVSTKTTWYGEKEKVEEPQYNIKAVDKKITELETWLFKADSAIKQSNAVVNVNIDSQLTVDDLLKPLE